MKGPIARGTVRTTFVLGLRLLIQAGTLLLVARMLGPDQFGAFAGVAALAVTLGTLSTFGTHLVLLGEVAKAPARRDDVLRYALPTTLLCGSLLLLVYIGVCMLALHDVGIALHVLLLLGAAEILLQPVIVLCASEHHGLGRIARSQVMMTLPLLLRLVAAAIVFVSHPPDPLGTYVWGYASASIVALAAMLVVLPAPWPPVGKWRLPRRADLGNTAGFAALNITAAGPAELDKTLAAALLPLGSAGTYAAAARVIGATTLPVSAMMLSALPRLFRDGRRHLERATRLLRWIFGSAAAYGIALALLLWCVAPAFNWIFGEKYGDIASIIRWLCPAIPGMTLRRAAGSVLMARGRPWMRVGFESVGLAVLAGTATVFTAKFGATGMPLALICSEWSMAILGAAFILSLHPHRIDETRNP